MSLSRRQSSLMNTTANSEYSSKTTRMTCRLLLQHHAYLKKSKSRGCLSAFGTGFGTPKGVPRFNSLTYQRKAGGLTRAILALALRAHCVRPKSLHAILSNPVRPHTPHPKINRAARCASAHENSVSRTSVLRQNDETRSRPNQSGPSSR